MKTWKLLSIAGIMFVLGMMVSQLFAAEERWDDDEVRTYDVNDFRRVHLEGGYRIILEQSDKPGLRIRADEDVFRYIEVNNEGDELEIRITKNKFDFERLELYITFTDLTDLHIEGGANLETKGYLNLNNFEVHVEGGAKIEMELKVDELYVLGEGGVKFDFEGVAGRFVAKISGAGHVDAIDLKAEDVRFEIEGVGAGSVHATETLKASIEGVGKFKYRGNPDVDKDINGIGYVNQE